MRSNNGFSLMELTIAVAVGGVMLIGLIKLYLTFQQNYRVTKMKTDLQMKMRYADNFLENAIHSAGSSDCLNENNKKSMMEFVQGYKANQMPQTWNIKPIKNTDVIVIAGCQYKSNQYNFVKTTYYIGDTHRKNRWHKPIYALYMKFFAGRRRELIENVSQMNIQYGVIENNNKHMISAYVPADKVQNWKNVRSVDIQLLLRSDDFFLKKYSNQIVYQPISIYAALRVDKS